MESLGIGTSNDADGRLLMIADKNLFPRTLLTKLISCLLTLSEGDIQKCSLFLLESGGHYVLFHLLEGGHAFCFLPGQIVWLS